VDLIPTDSLLVLPLSQLDAVMADQFDGFLTDNFFTEQAGKHMFAPQLP
jgi:hypothetical protein